MLAFAAPASAAASPPAGSTHLSAPAHPLGNATTNQYVGLRIGADRIDIDYVLDLAELTAYRTCQEDLHRACEPGTRGTPAEATRLCTPIASELQTSVDQRRLRLSVDRAQLAILAGVAGLSTARLECGLSVRTSIDAGDRIRLENKAYPGTIGWREVTATGGGLSLAASDVPATSASVRLTRYPADLLSSPPDARTADLVAGEPTTSAAGGSQAAAPAASSSGERGQDRVAAIAPRGLDRLSVAYTELVSRHNLTVWFGAAAVIAALLLGGLHAIAPGHGKTIMAAYLVSTRGTARQAATIGLTVAATHTAGVLGLAALLTVASVAPERIYPWLGALSGMLLLVVGVMLLVAAIRRGRGQHSHGHSHHGGHQHHHHPHHSRAGYAHSEAGRGHGHSHSHDSHGDPGREHDHHRSHEDHGHGNLTHEHSQRHLCRDQSCVRSPSGTADSVGQAHANLIAEPTGTGQAHANLIAEPTGTGQAHASPVAEPTGTGQAHANLIPEPTAAGQARASLISEAAGAGQARANLIAEATGTGHIENGAPPRRRTLIGMGVIGGLVPSPSALLVLLGGIALGRAWFGFLLVVAYGFGLAATLTGIGLALARGVALLRATHTTNRIAALLPKIAVVLPIITAALVVLVGSTALAGAMSGLT